MIREVKNIARWDDQKKKVVFELIDELFIEGYMIPPGYVTDFASIPWWFRWAIPSTGRHSVPAILHDYLYDENIGTRKNADKVFLQLMLQYNVPKWQAYLMFWGVRIGAKRWWDKTRKNK